MSKYIELKKAYEKAKAEFSAHKNACVELADDIYNAAIAYFEIPLSNVQLITINEEGLYEPGAPLQNTLVLLEDGFWYFGIGISLDDTVNGGRSEMVVFHLFVSHKDGEYIVRVGSEGVDYRFKKTSHNNYSVLFDTIFSDTMKGMESKNPFSKESQDGKLGFQMVKK